MRATCSVTEKENGGDKVKSEGRREEGKNCKNDGKWRGSSRERSPEVKEYTASVCVWGCVEFRWQCSLAHPEVLGVNRVSREDSWMFRLRPVSPTETAALCWPIWPSSSSSPPPPPSPQTFTWGWRSGHTDGDGGGVRGSSNSALRCTFQGWYLYLVFLTYST